MMAEAGLSAELRAAQALCEIYFNLAAGVLGEEEVRRRRDAILRGETCTGISASWCPVCGDCACPPDPEAGGDRQENPDCPLHGESSSHAEEVAPAEAPAPGWTYCHERFPNTAGRYRIAKCYPIAGTAVGEAMWTEKGWTLLDWSLGVRVYAWQEISADAPPLTPEALEYLRSQEQEES